MLGAELRKAREAAGLTQEKLAFASELDRTYISHLEHDKKSLTIDVLFRIGRVLDLPASELIVRVERAQSARLKKSRTS